MKHALDTLYEKRDKYQRALVKCSHDDLELHAKYVMHPNYPGRHLLRIEFEALIKEIKVRNLEYRFKEADVTRYMKARERRKQELETRFSSRVRT